SWSARNGDSVAPDRRSMQCIAVRRVDPHAVAAEDRTLCPGETVRRNDTLLRHTGPPQAVAGDRVLHCLTRRRFSERRVACQRVAGGDDLPHGGICDGANSPHIVDAGCGAIGPQYHHRVHVSRKDSWTNEIRTSPRFGGLCLTKDAADRNSARIHATESGAHYHRSYLDRSAERNSAHLHEIATRT